MCVSYSPHASVAIGNKLAKMKRAEFEKIMADFQESATVSQLEEFLDE